jgi:uracil-DNA glycosylase
MNLSSLKLDSTWQNHLKDEFTKDYMTNLENFLTEQGNLDKIIYPSKENIFEALNVTTLDNLKVVILGQDPYHGEGQAHGLSFSVNKGVKIPPSLRNIYKELNDDLNFTIPDHGDLTKWASQGVLLLNNVLTVEKSKAGSHQKKGWESFTDAVIELINNEKENVVFLLWGSPAQKKAKKVNTEKHYILKSPHPSPLSSYRGFFGCKHFSKCNDFLESKGISPIDWSIN